MFSVEKLNHPKFRLGIAILVTILFSTFAFFYYYQPQGWDDAWITYRYARNLAQGHGFVYNLGERVQGTSTPLYTLLLALLAWVGVDIPTASTALSLISVCLTAILIFLWLHHIQSTLSGLLGAAMLLLSLLYMHTVTSGLETALYCLLILLSFYLFYYEYNHAAFLCGGFCMLMRLDGAAVLLALFLAFLWRHRRLPLKELILPLILNIAWFGFARIHFGSMLPHSLVAKQYHTGHEIFPTAMFNTLISVSPLYWFLALVGIAFALTSKNERKLSILILWLGGYLLAYAGAGIGIFYPWYMIPSLMVLIFLAADGLGKIIDLFFLYGWKKWAAVGVVCILGLLPAPRLQAFHIQFSPEYVSLEQARYKGAQFSASYVPRNAVIAVGGIGMIGWLTNNYILDHAGLVSPQTLAKYPSPYFYHALEATIIKYQPQYVFDAAEFRWGWPPVLQEKYHVVAIFPHNYSYVLLLPYGSKILLPNRKNDCFRRKRPKNVYRSYSLIGLVER